MFSTGSKNQIILYDASERRWQRFSQPRCVLIAHRVEQVMPLLHQVERAVYDEHLYAAGFLTYEAAPAFDAALHSHAPDAFPLAWFGLYAKVDEIDRPIAPLNAGHQVGDWKPSVDPHGYTAAIHTIKEHIAAGDTYQVNYSYRLRAPFSGDPWTYFLQLLQAQEATYPAFVDTGRFAICSASPELFFQLEGQQLTSRPMKGTVARGLSAEEDVRRAEWLQQSEKNRAENVMIVDMIRNDMGRIAHVGSVSVPRLFSIERYPTVWQMTSTVTSQTDATLPAILQALFPCASITGAPKARTMQIIARLETEPRRIYTGAIGFLTPERRAQFNVAIRTVLVDRERQEAEYGVGGGIVWDSTDEGELEECATKARVLTLRRPAFQLLETILWTAEQGFALLDHHLERLAASAAYFSFTCDLAAVRRALQERTQSFTRSSYRLRLLLARSGDVTLQHYPFEADRGAIQHVCLAPAPIDSNNPFLYHKTTNRGVYERALAACPGFDDVLLWNERGELTESCLGNLVVELDGGYLTPPVSSGLLPGTYRRSLLEQERVREAVIHLDDLERYNRLWLVNSVRGWQPALLSQNQTAQNGPLSPAPVAQPGR